MKLLKKLLFLKWLWIVLSIWLIVECSGLFIFNYFDVSIFYQVLFTIVTHLIALYFYLPVIRSYKTRVKDYERVRQKWLETGIYKKSILYKMRLSPCGKTSAKLLCDEFNIKL